MRPAIRSTDDATGNAATGNIAGGMVLNSVLTTLTDKLDQVLVLTHLALGIPLAPLARDLKMNGKDLKIRVDRIRRELSRNAGLSAQLSGIQRAGQIEHYYPIIVRLGLQNWFCAVSGCTNLVIQANTGRPRKTCSDRHRSLLNRKQGITWQDRHAGGSQQNPDVSDPGDCTTDNTIALRDFLLQLMRPINYPPRFGHWDQPNIHCRDRALFLLGFTCPAPVTAQDLHDLNIGDVGKTSDGLEVKLYKNQKSQATRYVTIPYSDDPRLCAARALLSWRRILAREGRTTGPLFIRLGPRGHLPKTSTRLSGNAITGLVWQALQSWGNLIWRHEDFKLNNSMPLSDFLKRMISDADFRKAVSMLDSGPDTPLGSDPCEPRMV